MRQQKRMQNFSACKALVLFCLFLALINTPVDGLVTCPREALDLNIRCIRIVEEILRYRPTVLCLEEVDQFSYLQKTLKNCGYLGLFYPKPDSPCLYESKSYGPDGCAIFYNSSKLKLLESDNVILKVWNRESNQVSIICHFQTTTDDAKDFSIAVTHLKSDRDSDCQEIRVQQAKFLTQYLEDKHLDHPLILCGDMNFPPSERAYNVIKSCDLGLVSVNTHLSPKGCEPDYTFWTIYITELCKTLDYIWYSKKGLKVKSVLNMASEEEIGAGRLPSFKYPSDHLSQVTDLVLE